MEDTEYNVQENADKLCSVLIHTINPCIAILSSGKSKEAQECALWVNLYELSLAINSEENSSEVWRAIQPWRIKDAIRNLKKVKRKTSKMPFVQKRAEEMIKDIKKRRRD